MAHMKSCWGQPVDIDSVLQPFGALRGAVWVIDPSFGPLGRGQGAMMRKGVSDGKSWAAIT